MKKVTATIFTLCLWSVALFAQPIEGASVCHVYFSPKDGIADRLIERINSERNSIRVAVYCLMHSGIAKALNEAHGRGVDVEVIVDPFSVKTRSPIARMVGKGVSVYVWNPLNVLPSSNKKAPPRKPLMHDKFCVFGNDTVWTGSFNFTRDATTSHRENVIVLSGTEIAESFLKEFQAIKTEGCCPYAAFVVHKKDLINSK